MVGFTREKQRIFDQLIAGEDGLNIVAIVGMAGQGKTTLAQRVFQDSRVNSHFTKYAWCCISQAYDTKEVLLDILKNVGRPVPLEEIPDLTKEELADRLRKCLMGQKYLVILDDIWDVEAWNELQSSFPDQKNRSRILLTSREKNVLPLNANPCCCIVELHPLSSEESWDLLRVKVFEKDFCPSTLSVIGKMIAKKCKGLPLSIVVAAGLLKKDKSVDSWKELSERLNTLIASEGCLEILDLSYKHLPDYLKPCFLYFGAFREDQIIDAKRLIQLWIAEGFVKNDGMKSMEDVAKNYLIDLVARSLVFVVKRSSKYGIKKCRVHDLLRQLCLIKAKEERFLLESNVPNDPPSMRCNHYRLCVHDKCEPSVDFEAIVPSVRSLLVSHGSCRNYLKGFKLLTVLDLSCEDLSRTDFDEVTQLIHLRFLSVACWHPVPLSIVNLFRLEVLRLRNLRMSQGIVLPSVVMKMANLWHIYASSCKIEWVEDFDEVKLKLCPPLTNLETFTSFKFDENEKPFLEMVAQKLPNIRKLGLTLFFCVRLSSYFKNVESLNLCLLRRACFVPGIEVISPSTLDFPLTLKKLNLSTPLVLLRATISSIEELKNLEVLKLNAHFEDGSWDVEDDKYLKLKYLELESSSIQEWNVSDESFPLLKQLVVKRCPKLGELPGRFGAIPTLIRIDVRSCSSSVKKSFEHIVDEQKDSGNDDLQDSISDIYE